ncbi:MAG: AMP-binding protein [Acutalibacteraceae bacterium]|nr:AMP-binding protein [Acutalibacteraceae bacterium]
MKLSFSTKGWHGNSFDEFCEIAQDLNFKGIELHNIYNPLFTEKDGAFYDYAANATVRKLYEMKLSLPCIDTVCNPCDKSKRGETIGEITKCMQIAKNLHIPYVRIRAISDDSVESVSEIMSDVISEILPKAEQSGITILVETCGVYCDTAALRDLLERFASDNLAALWDMYSTYFCGNETADTTIKNLGAYVRHVHIKDAVKKGDATEFCLLGEGELPINEMMNALRSVNFDEFISLEWDPKWCEELDDMEIIFSQFVNFMRQFGDTSKNDSALYYNRAHTGKYVWEKDRLIDLTFSQVLDRMVEEFPDQYAFKYTTLDYTRTYSEFRDDVDEFARTLIALGVKAGSHVAVWASNVPQWYIAFWATVKLGAVLVTVNTAYKIHEIEYLLKQSDTHTLIMTEGGKDCNYGDVIAELCPELKNTKAGEPLHAKRLPFLRNVITVGYRLKGCLNWNEALGLASQVPISEVYRLAAAVEKDDVCNMQYTSGTTGFPKGVMLTHYNVVNNGKYIGDHMELSTADRMMIQVPMFHCFGMVLSMTASITHGATMSPLPYFSPKSALACINSERITTFNGVPTMFIAMMEHPDFAKTDFSHIRVGIMAGSNCPADLMKKATEVMNMREIVSVYGQTEASPGCTMSSYYDSLTVRTETVGSAFANVECKIVDPDTGKKCPNGVNGEFVARGYNIMKGYYKMPTATAEAIDENGWLHTGDLACRDDDGNYRITGRLKDMIIRGGENIYPKEIEEFIYTCDKVSDVQVIGVPDKQYGEEIMACIILKEGETMTEDEMKKYISDHMARHKVPRYIDFVDSFPMNAAGKILKYKMREDAVKKLGL